jgi:hypothetical protein
MKRVLPGGGGGKGGVTLLAWVRDFMPSLFPHPSSTSAPSDDGSLLPSLLPSLLRVPTVSDRSDARICHLDGLLLRFSQGFSEV